MTPLLSNYSLMKRVHCFLLMSSRLAERIFMPVLVISDLFVYVWVYEREEGGARRE